MAAELTCREAYLAAMSDVFAARTNFQIAKAAGLSSNEEEFVAAEITYLWERRIARGELPPLTTTDVRVLLVASGAA